jgi:hypothetical protein
MTRVNWQLLSGEQVEEFVSALLLLRHQGPGNRIKPSQGDRGVDVRLWDPEGTDLSNKAIHRSSYVRTSTGDRKILERLFARHRTDSAGQVLDAGVSMEPH